MQKGKFMSNGWNSGDTQQVLQRLARQGSESARETSVVTSPGARAAAWAVKIKSHSSYNVYNVRAVEIGDPGSLPVEIGQEMQAVNLAESFLEQGTLPAGTYVVMSRVGQQNVFYAPV
jgi:hypothetical protein